VDCSLVVDHPLFVTGILPYAAPGMLPDRPSSHVLFSPSRYHYQEGIYRGPLAILVDDGTASSAERFTEMLQANRAATVVGIPTAGAGCGYTNGGIPVRLKMTSARVKVPDCVQFRRAFSNLVEGITPDVLVPWRSYDAPFQRATRAATALGLVAKRQSPKRRVALRAHCVA
jgi:C-terminal processing protease CtpA/Prc